MAMGVCMECKKLVSIAPRGMHLLSGQGSVYSDRQREWYPVAHQNSMGNLCLGEKQAIR